MLRKCGNAGRSPWAATAVLVVASVRSRWTSLAGAFVAISLGVGLITMTMLIWGSSGAQVPPRVEGAPLFAVSPQASNENGTAADHRPWTAEEGGRLAEELSRIGGVARAIPDRTFYAQTTNGDAPVPAGDEALSAGHGWSSAALAPYRLTSGSEPRGENQVVLDSRLGFFVGQQVSVLFVAGPRMMTVSGVVDTSPSSGRPPPIDKVVYVADDLASKQAPGVFAIALTLNPDASTSDVSAAAASMLGDQGAVVDGRARSKLEPKHSAHQRYLGTQLVSAMALLGGFVSVFVVASTCAFNVAQRRRELGLLKMIGGLPRQIQGLILGEAIVTGLVGGVVGTALGMATAPLMGRFLQYIGVATPDYVIRFSATPLLGAIGIGVIVATLGAWAASRRAAKTAPMEALRNAAVEDSAMSGLRWTAGAATAVFGLISAVLSATANSDNRIYFAIATTMALTIAVTALTPAVTGPVVRILTWPGRRSRKAGPMLLRAELVGASSRTTALAAPVIATVAFAVLISGYVETSRDAYPAQAAEPLRGQSIVWPHDKPGLTDQEVERASASGVVRAGLATRVFVDKPGEGATVLDGVGWLEGSDRGPDNVVVSTLLAEKFEWSEGQTIETGFVDGTAKNMTIVAVREIDPARVGFNISRNVVREHDPGALTEAVFISQDSAPTNVGAGAVVYDAYDYAVADYERDSWLMRQFSLVLIFLAVGYTAIAVANTSAMSARGRRDGFRVLQMAGGTVRQVVTVVAAESAVIVGIGVGLGLLVSVPAVVGIASGFSATVGRSVDAQFNPVIVMSAVSACFLLAIGAGTFTTWRTIRTHD